MTLTSKCFLPARGGESERLSNLVQRLNAWLNLTGISRLKFELSHLNIINFDKSGRKMYKYNQFWQIRQENVCSFHCQLWSLFHWKCQICQKFLRNQTNLIIVSPTLLFTGSGYIFELFAAAVDVQNRTKTTTEHTLSCLICNNCLFQTRKLEFRHDHLWYVSLEMLLNLVLNTKIL